MSEPKAIHFDLYIEAKNNLKHQINYIKHHEFLAKQIIKKEISRLLFKYKDGNNIHEHIKQ